jgi:transcriptional regulator with XRE-family HTH domain
MINEELKASRARLKMTQVQLADALNVTPTTIARWERGEVQPEAPAMLRLALAQLELLRLETNPSRAIQSRLAKLKKINAELRALTAEA